MFVYRPRICLGFEFVGKWKESLASHICSGPEMCRPPARLGLRDISHTNVSDRENILPQNIRFKGQMRIHIWVLWMTGLFRRDILDASREVGSFPGETDLHQIPETRAEYRSAQTPVASLKEFEKPEFGIELDWKVVSEEERPVATERFGSSVSGPIRECSECGKPYRGEGRNQKQCNLCTVKAWSMERSEQYRKLVAMLWHDTSANPS